MSNVLLGVIGVILFIGLALAGALLLGERFTDSKNEAEAARYMSEGAQIAQAYELYRLNEGRYPDAPADPDRGLTASDAKIVQLKDTGYLKDIPLGGKPSGSNSQTWYIDETRSAALTYIGDDTTSKDICINARKQAGMPDPENVLECTADNIANNDPCCLG